MGDDPLAYALRELTTQARSLPADAGRLHATEIRGRGFLVVPVGEPTAWDPGDETALVDRLEALVNSDYRQTKGVATRIG